ncbi:MAG: putative toxin-antitoxin system toxin component, PIN family [Chloroflexia bacterium]|nr:putative toxin-antitoxin system toxin component, PIN family [Chloroflexia bacterium]
MLDANILISYLLTVRPESAPTAIIHAALNRRYTLLLPEELFLEVRRRVATKLYLSARIAPADIERFRAILAAAGEGVPPLRGPLPEQGRDRKDDYLLACAHRDGADYLITRDHDLLDLPASSLSFTIVLPGEFLRLARNAAIL